jgi:hypothetical protein
VTEVWDTKETSQQNDMKNLSTAMSITHKVAEHGQKIHECISGDF